VTFKYLITGYELVIAQPEEVHALRTYKETEVRVEEDEDEGTFKITFYM